MKDYNTLDDFNVENKTVLLRVDFNMPLDKKTLDITDDTRIRLALPTIKELVNKNAKTVILAHQGKQGSWDFISMQKHAQMLAKLLGKNVTFIDDIYGEKAKNAIKTMKPGTVVFLDNVRKYTAETEKKKPEEHARSELVQNLSPLADFYVNDAFAAAHRAQCSLTGFTVVLPSVAGRLMEKELTALEKAVSHPEKPSIFLFGGAKFADVIITIDRILSNKIADHVLLTGLTANAFLKAKGVNLGKKNEQAFDEEGTPEVFTEIKNVYKKFEKQIHLPTDFAIEEHGKRKEITLADLPVDNNLFDIGEKTIQEYKKILGTAKTIFISGPCGVYENPFFRKGTEEIFAFITTSKAFSIVGGGHTVAAIEQMKLRDKITHISTGGGALEKFMMGEKLAVVEALKAAKQRQLVHAK
ncbi:MAG: phosphoglycerate kinase [Thermoplasmata archaeon]|nr:phosphoglycerate kinase [Thermoplasmata archaeon]MBE3140306.1 phosphoglycerate kinase [Thermoplasmata archaeon]